ncbi:MAG TPA: acylphosphatase [Solirubrobacteraceae bacterium]
MSSSSEKAVRAAVSGSVQGVGFRHATRGRAHELRVMGWVRNAPDGTVLVHAEGAAEAVAALLSFLQDGPPLAEVSEVAVEEVKVEGHEQFAIRGLSAGSFVVEQHEGTRFTLRLEVDGSMRSWTLPKGPSLDPAVKRFAVELEQAAPAGSDAGATAAAAAAAIWDRGAYEQGGRVPWPQAIERGHAVFVLHGEKLRGGFALQRTRAGAKPQWLLVKRRDEQARPGSDILAERSELDIGN